MAASSDFINGEEIDDLLMAINEDIFGKMKDFLEDVDSYVTEIENISDFPCNHCDKSCKGTRGMTRHLNCKHRETTTTTVSEKKKLAIFDRSIDVNNFSGLLRNCLRKMEEDECLPVGILEEDKNDKLSPDDVAHTYNCLQHVVNEFTLRGDGEKFYLHFLIVSKDLNVCFHDIGITLFRVTSSSDFIINFQLGRRFNCFTRLHNSLNEL